MKKALQILALVAWISKIDAATFYVAPNGCPSNNGLSTNSPWPFGYAITNAGAGATVMMMDGPFTDGPYFVANASNTFKAINKLKPTFWNIAGSKAQGLIYLPGAAASGTVIDGLAFSNCQYTAVYVLNGARNVALRNLWVQHTGKTFPPSSNASGVALEPGSDNLVERCILEFNGTNNTGQNHGIYCGGTNGGYRANVCRYNGGLGIVLNGHAFYDKNNQFYENLIYGNNNGDPVSDEQFAFASDTPSSFTNYAYGNTIISRGDYAIYCKNTDCRITNNVIVSTNDGIWHLAGTTPSCDYNSAPQPLAFSGPHDVVNSYMGFVNATNGLYWLKSDSPARRNALAGVCGSVDFFGNPQVLVEDIGAFQHCPMEAADNRVLDPSPPVGPGYWDTPFHH